ncbi:MAG: hypothetical protein JWO05_646 [Gemmatimonadetes bacterium]|nr:hypothetical protein [Gemmatimonadota bacterium]
MLTDSTPECVTCRAPIASPYCPQCGERRASDRHLSLFEFAEDALEAFTHFDGRLLRTLKSLALRPGELAVAWVRGSRVPYVSPLQLFLIANLVFFLCAGAIGNHVFDTPLRSQLGSGHARAFKREMLARKLHVATTDSLEFRRRATAFVPTYDTQSFTLSKSLVFVLIPPMALVVGLLEWRRRRFAAQHVVFAFNAFSAFLLLMVAIGAPMTGFLHWRATHGYSVPGNTDNFYSYPLVGAWAIWMALGFRRAYGDHLVMAAAKALVVAFSFLVALSYYRVLLFIATSYST